MKTFYLISVLVLLLLVFGCAAQPRVQNPPLANSSQQPAPQSPAAQTNASPPVPPIQNQANSSSQPPPTQSNASSSVSTQTNSTTPGLSSQVTIRMTAHQFAFDPSTITVKKGDKVHLIITSLDVTHGFSLPAFNVNAQIIPGQDTIIDFVADQSGEFDFRCSVVCGAGHSEMSGKLIVQG